MIDFLIKLMEIESTSGNEGSIADYLSANYKPAGSEIHIQEISKGLKNVFYSWGKPEIIFNSHFDTVPPYLPPKRESNIIYGRGSCDAKGQLVVMSQACEKLYKEGFTNFGLLMTAGEEVGSYGAIKANEEIKGVKYCIVGEPTENKLIKASKGNINVDVIFHGRSCHSGYPEHGVNAISRMNSFINLLDRMFADKSFPDDAILGLSTYNIGMLNSPNAHNVISEYVRMKIFFRTTFATHDMLIDEIKKNTDEDTEIIENFRHVPVKFETFPGFETGIVSYGTDAPSMPNLGKKVLYGPGSILDAHTSNEHIKIKDMEQAVDDLMRIYKCIINLK